MSRCYRFRIALSYQQYLHYYQGHVQAIVVRSDEGLRLQLPAARLRPFVTAMGIHGRFELELDALNQTQRLERIGD